MEKKIVGKVTHFFQKIGVAVVDVSDELRVGDRIVIETGSGPIEQAVESMQIEHEQINVAMPGQSIGLKVNGSAHQGNMVYKLVE
ncbi:MAG: translation elongation factor-like protein [Candidatus Micrarchaeota archaeon]